MIVHFILDWLFMLKDRWLFGNWETRSIHLSNGNYAIVDAEDYPLVSRFSWHQTGKPWGLVVRNFAEQQLSMKRQVLGFPNCEVVTQRNGNPLDCRKANLEMMTRQERQNRIPWRPVKKHSPYRGVHFDKELGKYRVRVRVDGRLRYFGIYEDELAAAHKYNEIALEVHGQKAQLNLLPE